MDNIIKLGETYIYSFTFTQEEVIKFAEASGDFNPIHLDFAYAKNTIFGIKNNYGYGHAHVVFQTVTIKEQIVDFYKFINKQTL